MGKKKKSKSMEVMPAMDRKWEVESAADALMRAEKIKMDKKLFGEAKRELTKKEKAIKKVK